MSTTKFRVPMIHCSGCVANIAAGVERLPGVAHVEGDAQAKTITVAYDASTVGVARLRQAIAERGFAVEGELNGPPERVDDAHAAHAHAPRRGRATRFGLTVLAVAAALAIAGYLLGFLAYAYGVAVPQAFGRFSVVAVAAISGVAAFFSPCVFPLLPGYVVYQLRPSGERWRLGRAATIGLAGAAGVVVVNLALGGVIAALGAATPFQPDPRKDIPAVLAVRFLAGAAIVILGVLAIGGRSLGQIVARVAGVLVRTGPGAAAGLGPAFVYGLTYNAAGIGCTGPILLSLVLYAVASRQALLAFGVFSLTMGALMLGLTVASGLVRQAAMHRLAVAADPMQRIGGIILILVGTYTMLSLSFAAGRQAFVRTFLPFLP